MVISGMHVREAGRQKCGETMRLRKTYWDSEFTAIWFERLSPIRPYYP